MSSKQCIFCDRTAESYEHLWSKRLGPELKKFVKPYGADNRSWKSVESFSSTGFNYDVKGAGQAITSTVIKCVCHRCNNEWMNNLDLRTHNKLVRLIRGQVALYSKEDAQALAAWLAMKMMVRESWPSSIPALTRDQTINFYLTGMPPSSMKIDIARNAWPLWAAAFQRQHASITSSSEVVRQASCTMGFGKAIVFAEYSTDLALSRSVMGMLPHEGVTLWPNPTAFDWPCSDVLRPERISTIASRYTPGTLSAAESRFNFEAPPRPAANRKERRRQRRQ